MEVAGVDRGIHAILVRIRDDNLQVVPGVRVEDMGHKMGLNGVDNAKLVFDNVRVPRENLLNRLLFYLFIITFPDKICLIVCYLI